MKKIAVVLLISLVLGACSNSNNVAENSAPATLKTAQPILSDKSTTFHIKGETIQVRYHVATEGGEQRHVIEYSHKGDANTLAVPLPMVTTIHWNRQFVAGSLFMYGYILREGIVSVRVLLADGTVITTTTQDNFFGLFSADQPVVTITLIDHERQETQAYP
ncbi:MAG: hypothetical protein H0T53_14740 [Herpetosiphonaceae bacterium]|nr:hypothetical protein [Herpetosiphonaceae bacterium]